jgi:hypothetical protein
MKLRIGSTAMIAFAALSMSAVSADAGLLVSTTPSCDAGAAPTQVFSQWLDPFGYAPLPGGDFESAAAGWTLNGGAKVVAGNESYAVGGSSDASSLSIPAGGSATSPAVCVDLAHPTIRFFAKRNSGGLLGLSQMSVEVLFQNNLGILNSLPIGVVTPSSSWQPTLPMTILANLLPLSLDAGTPVQFRFTPLLGGDWSMDDVYVDPYQRR